jgi:hypothetical protein
VGVGFWGGGRGGGGGGGAAGGGGAGGGGGGGRPGMAARLNAVTRGNSGSTAFLHQSCSSVERGSAAEESELSNVNFSGSKVKSWQNRNR